MVGVNSQDKCCLGEMSSHVLSLNAKSTWRSWSSITDGEVNRFLVTVHILRWTFMLWNDFRYKLGLRCAYCILANSTSSPTCTSWCWNWSRQCISSRHRQDCRMRSIGTLMASSCKSLLLTFIVHLNQLTSLVSTFPGTWVTLPIMVWAVAGVDYSEVYEENSQSLQK